MILWNDTVVDIQRPEAGRYSVSGIATIRHTATTFKLTVVYGPTRRAEKDAFLRHLRLSKPPDDTKWLLLGDFNLIYRAQDKNNNLDLSLMRRFRRTLSYCELNEIHLQNRKYTWSNERRRPTLVRLDRFFCNQSWDLHFESHSLHALSTAHSDHCPLLLCNQTGPRPPAPFRFENIWTKMPRFMETVQEAWGCPTTHTEPFHRLGHKLYHTGRALKAWSRAMFSDARLKLHMAQEVILRFDEAQENRELTSAERSLRQRLKSRILGWAVLERARKKQCARINYLREGDANTKFFHLRANARRRINFIQKLRNDSGWAVSHEEKQPIVQDHFESTMGQPNARSRDFLWETLQLPATDLTSLDNPFTEHEV